MKCFYYAIALLLVNSASWAQGMKLSGNPDQFLGDLQKLMNVGGSFAQRAEKNLESIWTDNRLSALQRDRIIVLSRKMSAKQYQPAPHFALLYETIYYLITTQQVTPTEVDNVLTIAEKAFESYDAKTFVRIFETARLFAEKRQFYAANYNKLAVSGGTFSFRLTGIEENLSIALGDSARSGGKTLSEGNQVDGWDTPVDSTTKRPTFTFIPNKRALPTPTGPVVDLKGADLIIMTAQDSVGVKKTDGVLELKSGTFVGKGGTFTWEPVGEPETFVTLADYSLVITSPKLVADDVSLACKALAKPIKGVFEFDSKKRNAKQLPSYPRFMSWDNDAVLTNLGSEITYRGGLTLTGVRMYSSSLSNKPATIAVKYKGKLAFLASSRLFELTDADISASVASFTGYIDTDSLYHPGVTFNYNRETAMVRLGRANKTAYSDTYFSDSYHKFYIQPEVVRWDMARQKVDFYQIGAKQEVPVRFESYDFFYPQRYADMVSDYGFQPLQLAANYVATTKRQTFFANDLAQFGNINPKKMQDVMSQLVALGYVDMDPQTEEMRLSRRGVLYVLANAGKKDYDNFLIRSIYPSNDSIANASINLNNNYLVIRGVEKFSVSDSLKISVVPSDKTLRIGRNRAFMLTGQVKSGSLRYTGKDLTFDYDQFSMNMNKVDSITFTQPGKEMEVGGDIQYEKPGTVFLADKGNKSGKQKGKKNTQRLVMPEGMTVYFNQAYRGDILYNKNVFFKIPAVDKDSLGKGDITFEGTFYSDGIFPPIKTKLKTMPDNSLGFEHMAPAAGYPLYGGKGNLTFTGKLIMDKKGLRTEGIISHLTASLPTNNMLIMTDSLLASGETGQIKEGLFGKTFFPAVDLKNYSVKWYPKADSMTISTQDGQFSFYNGTTSLKGDLVLRPDGIFGKGTVKRTDSEAVSDNLKFVKEGFTANKAQFRVMSADKQSKPIVQGVQVDVDFNQVKGLVTLTTDAKNTSLTDTLESSIELPNVGYRTSISRAQWNIPAKIISMQGKGKTSTFTATAREQEGLSFNATAAVYGIEKAMLTITGVPYILSADARIYPDKELVSVKQNGEMLPLKNARLELDTVSLFHKLKNGTIQIQSRTRFVGDATYQYLTAKGDTANIKMGSFERKESTSLEGLAPGRKKHTTPAMASYFTVARATVDEKDNLLLARKVQFKGEVTMQAPEQDLKMEGSIKVALKKRKQLASDWIPFKEKITETFSITIDQNLKNESNQALKVGLHIRNGGSSGLYPTFLSTKEEDSDDDLFNTTGTMVFDDQATLFRIARKEADGLSEEVFTFNDDKGEMRFQGPVNLVSTGASSSNFVLASGVGTFNVDSTLLRLNAFVAFGFQVPQPLSAAIANKIVKANLDEQNNVPADEDLNHLTDKLIPLIGQKAANEYRAKAQNQHVSVALASPKLISSLVLSNLNLRWSEKYNALYSIGKIGVSHIDNVDINAEMDGFVEIRKASRGDDMTIYLEASPDSWFYWDYKSGQLALLTSDQELNDRITAGGKNSGKSIEVVLADVIEKAQFTDRYLDQYKTKEKPKPQPKAIVKKDAIKKEEKKKGDDKKEGF